MKKLLFVVNTPEFFLSHRLPIALAAKQAGYEVHVATAAGNGVGRVLELGFAHHVIPLARSGQNPFREIHSILSLYRLFLDLKPELIHLITIKPVLYGGLAARFLGEKAIVAAVSGLGTAFSNGNGLSNARRKLVSKLYSLAFRQKRLRVIFQNPNDRDMLIGLGALRPDQACMIRGSGVDLQAYPFLPEPEDIPVVVMASRLLREKGVFEFVQAARLLKARGVTVRMRLIGAIDPGNPTSVTDSELADWKAEGVVELPGYRSDIPAQYAAANIVCLPSFYGEGLPKTLVEGAACGRAIITTDHPGCRDAIEPGKTGILVPVRDSIALADAIEALLASPRRRVEIGKAGRELAERAYSIEKIVSQHMSLYRKLLSDE